MVRVADEAIEHFGDASLFHYQAVLGLMISEQFQSAHERLSTFKDRLSASDPLALMCNRLSGVLEEKLAASIGLEK